MCVFSVWRWAGVGAGSSAVAVVSHKGDDAGRRSGELEEGVLEELLGRGSLRGLSHQHQVQEGAQHRGHLRSRINAVTLFLLIK